MEEAMCSQWVNGVGVGQRGCGSVEGQERGGKMEEGVVEAWLGRKGGDWEGLWFEGGSTWSVIGVRGGQGGKGKSGGRRAWVLDEGGRDKERRKKERGREGGGTTK
ncbi:hypothetical protein GOBAR_AA07892 [Gossypium barbadense]|uniref:Uncharacterized protein n=1 Tax=Gossypium barbadense TaxID=3634 RepID=A0A2P5YAW7_GOSBA|nr:hypothetical protein GOBAR_AA07892 [Gossypium barbadense]